MFDGATGQYYLRARFYHPEIGRFMQEDVYRGDGLNLYAYCANNLVMYYDPSGYWRWSVHSHPGISRTVLAASEADRLILKEFNNQTYSSTVNSMGVNNKFSKDWSDWLPNY